MNVKHWAQSGSKRRRSAAAARVPDEAKRPRTRRSHRSMDEEPQAKRPRTSRGSQESQKNIDEGEPGEPQEHRREQGGPHAVQGKQGCVIAHVAWLQSPQGDELKMRYGVEMTRRAFDPGYRAGFGDGLASLNADRQQIRTLEAHIKALEADNSFQALELQRAISHSQQQWLDQIRENGSTKLPQFYFLAINVKERAQPNNNQHQSKP